MAESQSNASSRADDGTPTIGVIHVRTRLDADFTVVSNALAQLRGSAITVGVGLYIASLPDGSRVSIAALCEHFEEGEILVSRALRVLEEAGYLERRRERLPSGQIRTRTYFHDVPRGGHGERPEPPKPRRPGPDRAEPAVPVEVPAEAVEAPAKAEEPGSLSDVDPQAVAVLGALRRVDQRLVLSEREAVRLAPAVGRWLAAGVGAAQITELLTARLPDTFRVRPAGILAYRLRETPLAAPPPPPRSPHPSVPERRSVPPFQTCDGCERAFRAPVPGRCRDCRSGDGFQAVG